MFARKVTLVCLCLSVTAVIGADNPLTRISSYENDPPAKIPSLYDSTVCLIETNATAVEVWKICDGKLPTKKSQYCFLTCYWKKANVMTEDDLFSVKKAIEYIQLRFRRHIMSTKAVKNAVELCFRAASTLTGKCTLGGYMYKCLLYRHPDIKSFFPMEWQPQKLKFEKI